MQYSDPEYPIIRFDYAVLIHDIAGIVLTLSYIFFLLGNIFTSNGNQYLFRLKGYFKNVSKQFRYYAYGMFKGEKPPFEITEKNKFNPLQRFSYVVIMYIATPIVVVTGLMLLYPEYFLHDIFGSRSIHYTDLIHVVVGFIISLFMVIHVYFCTIGLRPWSNFRAMFTGFHEKH